MTKNNPSVLNLRNICRGDLRGISFALFLCLLLVLPVAVFPQSSPSPSPVPVEEEQPSAPVTLDGQTVFLVRAGYKGLTIDERALNISARLKKLADDGSKKVEDFKIAEDQVSTDVLVGDTIVIATLDVDAEAEGKTRASIAADRLTKVKTAVTAYRDKYGLRQALVGSGFALLTILAFLGILFLVRRRFQWLRDWVLGRISAFISSRKWRILALVDSEQITKTVALILNLIRLAVLVTLTFISLQLILGFLPWTANFASGLLGLLIGPLWTLGSALVKEIPNLIFIGVVVVITYYALSALKAFFRAIQFGKISFGSFAPEWAMFTYRLVKIGMIILAAIISFPYIPGSDSEAFRGITIFLGVLVSFGSSSIVANTVGGITLNYLRSFNVGDRVQIGEYTGDIIRSTLQVTHLRTIKNEEVIVPNAVVVGSNIVNFTTHAKDPGLILHTKVTIGYDAPWRQVHALLLLAAERTEGLLASPKPFILQTSLDDFYVSYELNVFTLEPQLMARIYSDLHKNIQDAFNEYEVQIMSPNYMMDRSESTYVPKEKWFEAPAEKEPVEEKEPGDVDGRT